MSESNDFGEGAGFVFLVAITFLIIVMATFYRTGIKPCGWFDETDHIRNEVPKRCLGIGENND